MATRWLGVQESLPHMTRSANQSVPVAMQFGEVSLHMVIDGVPDVVPRRLVAVGDTRKYVKGGAITFQRGGVKVCLSQKSDESGRCKLSVRL